MCNNNPPVLVNATSDYDITKMIYTPGDTLNVTCQDSYEWQLGTKSQEISCETAGWTTAADCLLGEIN